MGPRVLRGVAVCGDGRAGGARGVFYPVSAAEGGSGGRPCGCCDDCAAARGDDAGWDGACRGRAFADDGNDNDDDGDGGAEPVFQRACACGCGRRTGGRVDDCGAVEGGAGG